MRLPLPDVPRYPNCGLLETESGPMLRAGSQDFILSHGGGSFEIVADAAGGFEIVADAAVDLEIVADAAVEQNQYLDLYLHGPDQFDPADAESVAAFVRRYGWVEPPKWHEVADYNIDVPLLRPAFVQAARDADAALKAERSRHPREWVEVISDVEDTFLEDPLQVGLTLGLVRELTTLYLLLIGKLAHEEAVAQLAGGIVDPGILDDENGPGRELSVLLGVGLRPFHVAVDFSSVDGPPWIEPYDLFNVLCLSLANDIADDADFKRCANETCGRWFTRHRGRATQGKYHMTGVKYCSVECARAQKQREYRRRQRQKGAKP